jgi:glutathione-regulated potassium-efflux system ancillary protein KefC
MIETWALAALWLSLALAAAVLATRFRMATALSEVITGIVAQFVIGIVIGTALLPTDAPWVKFLAGAGAIMLTFLAGAELDPEVLRVKAKEAVAVGLASFLIPALGCAAATYFLLGWALPASMLVGVALAATSVAVVYTVMLETGFNRTEYGKTILAACFVTDLATVLALGFLFAPFTVNTVVFWVAALLVLVALPWLTPRFFRHFGGRPNEPEAKFLLMVLFGMSALALWSGNEVVLPAYLIGMVLAGTVGTDHALVRRLRTLSLGLLTPFYFIRAGSLVSIPALIAAPFGFVLLLSVELVTKFIGVYPATKFFGAPRKEAMYTTLIMSTGLTFGTISALFGLGHGIIDQAQYSLLVATIIGTAIIPAVLANAFFLPHHLLPKASETTSEPAKMAASQAQSSKSLVTTE